MSEPVNEIEMQPVQIRENDDIAHKETMISQASTDFLNRIDDYVLRVKQLDTRGNSLPLGMVSFSMSFFLYSLALCGAFDTNALVVSNMFLIGAVGLTTAGCFEYIKGRTLNGIIFMCYGTFCITHVTIIIVDSFQWFEHSGNKSLASYYFFWCLVSFVVTACTFRSTILITLVCLLTSVMYLFFIIGYGAKSNVVIKIGGAFGVVSSLIAMYICCAETVNDSLQKRVMPLFEYTKPKK